MKIATKRFLYTLFFSFFFLLSPIVLLFASGYRMNLKNFSFQPTGALVVSTYPRGAIIYLNNKKIKVRTPAIIRYVFPGEYMLRLEKKSYFPLEKKIKIKSGKTLFLEKIQLEPISKIASSPFG